MWLAPTIHFGGTISTSFSDWLRGIPYNKESIRLAQAISNQNDRCVMLIITLRYTSVASGGPGLYHVDTHAKHLQKGSTFQLAVVWLLVP